MMGRSAPFTRLIVVDIHTHPAPRGLALDAEPGAASGRERHMNNREWMAVLAMVIVLGAICLAMSGVHNAPPPGYYGY